MKLVQLNIPRIPTDTEATWVAQWGIRYPNAEDLGTWHFETLEDAKRVCGGDPRRLWTIVQSDAGKNRDYEVIVPGVHIVNRVAYLVSEKPWSGYDLIPCYLWWDYDNQTEELVDIEGA